MMYELIFGKLPIEVYCRGKDIYVTQDGYLRLYAMAP